MNVDDNQQTPSRYGVRGIPNLILFKGGNHEQRSSVGAEEPPRPGRSGAVG